MNQFLLGLSRPSKRAIVVAVDVVLALFSTWAAYSLRLETLHRPQGTEWWIYLSGPLIAIPIFIRMGLYRAIFRYTGLDALMTTGQAVGLYAMVHLVVLQWYWWPTFPLTLGVLQPILFLLLVGISRAMARFWLAGVGFGRSFEKGRVLIYGAGTVGVQTSSAMAIAGGLRPLGFIDEDPAKIGQTINGLPVFAPSALPEVVKRLDITDVLLAIPSATREHRNQIIGALRALHVHTRT
ncbi:MAG TPA: polysaccharide biosynthesis protein, partial [Rhodoferax sp.]|nr:polysaccharide biosynthesis protein [Rhodoferax sp.]